MKLLENKTALITGASRGIGRAHALLFAEEGANIIFTDLKENEQSHSECHRGKDRYLIPAKTFFYVFS